MVSIFKTNDVLEGGNRVELVRQLDAGAQAEIWEVRDLEYLERNKLALKIYYTALAERDTPAFQHRAMRLENEFRLLGKVENRYIVKPIFRVTGTHKSDDSETYFYSGITMYLATEGNLDKFILAPEFSSLGRRDKIQFLIQIVEGLKGVHAFEIVHNDVKPKNILVFKETSNQFVPMFSDFGISFKLGDAPILGGTLPYMAPEVLIGQAPTVASDVYSLGLVFCLFLTGTLPIEELRDRSEKEYKDYVMGWHSTHEFIPTEKISSATNAQIAELVKMMCSRVPAHRPKLGEIAVTLDQLNNDLSSQEIARPSDVAPHLANHFKWHEQIHAALAEREYFFFIRGSKPDRDVAWIDSQLGQKRIYGYSIFRLLGSSDYLLRIWAGPAVFQQVNQLLHDYKQKQNFGDFRLFTPTFRFPMPPEVEELKFFNRTTAISTILSLCKESNPKKEIDAGRVNEYESLKVITGRVKSDRENGLPAERRNIRIVLRIRARKMPTEQYLRLATKEIFERLTAQNGISEIEVFSDHRGTEGSSEFLLIFEMNNFFRYRPLFDALDKMLTELDSELVGAYRTHFELDDKSYAESHDGSIVYEAIKRAS
jgi:serine/threonine protein kinase